MINKDAVSQYMKSKVEGIDERAALGVGVRYATSPMFRLGVNSGISGGLGMASALFDKEDDNVLSVIGKGIQAVALEHAIEQSLIIGGQTYLNQKGMPNWALKHVTGGIKDPKVREATNNLINSEIKKRVPLPKKAMAIGAGGAAAGMLYTMLNGEADGAKDTLTNMVVGAGLSYVGAEIWDHYNGEPNNPRSWMRNGVGKYLESPSGKLVKDNYDLLLKTDAGQMLSKEINKILGSKDGQHMMSVVNDALDGKYHKLVTMDMDAFNKSMQSVTEQLDNFVEGPNGKEFMKHLNNIPNTPEGRKIVGNLSKISGKSTKKTKKQVKKILRSATKQTNEFIKTHNAKAIDVEKYVKDLFKNGNVQDIIKKHGSGPGAVGKIITELAGTNKELFGQILNDFQKVTLGDISQSIDEPNAEKVTKGNGSKDTINVGKVAQVKAGVDGQGILDKESALKRAKNFNSKLGVAIGIGAVAIGAASVMDTSNNMNEGKRAERMKRNQERELARKQGQEKRLQKQMGYGHVDMGEMAFEMFNQRTGHHLMGNAKFQ